MMNSVVMMIGLIVTSQTNCVSNYLPEPFLESNAVIVKFNPRTMRDASLILYKTEDFKETNRKSYPIQFQRGPAPVTSERSPQHQVFIITGLPPDIVDPKDQLDLTISDDPADKKAWLTLVNNTVGNGRGIELRIIGDKPPPGPTQLRPGN